MHIFISHVLIPSKAMLARLFCLSSANFLRSLCWALHSVQPPTKDDISSLLNRQRAHCTLCRVVIKKASGGKKSQWWFSLMAVVRAIQRDEDVIVVLIDMCVHPGWLPGCINCMAGKGGPATWWWWKQAGSGPASRAGEREPAPPTRKSHRHTSTSSSGPQGHEERGPADRPSNVH